MTPVNLMEQTGHSGAITSKLWLRCEEFMDILMDQSQCPIPQLSNQKIDLPYLRLHGTQQHLLLMNGKPGMYRQKFYLLEDIDGLGIDTTGTAASIWKMAKDNCEITSDVTTLRSNSGCNFK